LLVKSVSITDLSLIGPMSAYKPAVGLLLGAVLLNEEPTLAGCMGVLVILIGSAFLSPGGMRPGIEAMRRLMIDRGVQFRLLSLVLTAGASIYSKAAVTASSIGHTFMGWAFFGAPLAIIAMIGLSDGSGKRIKDRLRIDGSVLGILVILFFPLQILTLAIFEHMHVGYALALFQLSSLVNVLFGYKLFAEKNILERIAASLVMIVGASLIIIWG
jgi:drug/metabolite transporter (DMT)-like permease